MRENHRKYKSSDTKWAVPDLVDKAVGEDHHVCLWQVPDSEKWKYTGGCRIQGSATDMSSTTAVTDTLPHSNDKTYRCKCMMKVG